MAGETGFGIPGGDPFSAFWTDFIAKMGTSGMPAMQPSPDFTEKMRKAFFESMTKYAEEYMRSDSFLKSMKQSMDHALAWQQGMNQMLQSGLAGAQMPSRADADHVVVLVRGMEDRLMGRLDDLQKRLEKLEKSGPKDKK